MADDRTYIKLHDGMPGHPKIRGLSDRAFRTLVRAWCYCSEYLTDGHVVPGAARDLGAPKVWQELVVADLAESMDDGGYWMHDYLEHQRSAQQIAELKEKRRRAGRLGGRPTGSKPKASAPASAKQVPNQKPKQNGSKNNPETESLTDVRDQADSEASASAPNAGLIVKAWIDRQRRRPAERVVGQVARQVRELLDQDFTAAEIDAGLTRMDAKSLNPSVLSSLVSNAANNVTAISNGHLTPQQIDDILGPDSTWQLPEPPPELDPVEDWVGYQAWCRQMTDEHRAEREQRARTELARRVTT